MGLDITVKKCADLAAAKVAEEKYDAAVNDFWHFDGRPYDDLTEDEKNQANAKDEKYCQDNQLDRFGSPLSIQNISDDVISKIDPEHYFKIDYYRSSYNESGINNVLRNLGLPGLYEIFDYGDEYQYEFTPDWDQSLVRVNDAIAKYEAHLNSDAGKFNVMEVSPMYEFGAADEKQALGIFMEAFNRESGSRCFSNRDGQFYLDGLKVRGIITKTFTPSEPGDLLGNMLNRPSVFLVFDREDEGKEDWHLTALKIVRESIEYVISQPDREHYFLQWSA